MKKVIFPAIGALASFFIVWCYGMDLTQRGVDLGNTVVFAIFSAYFAWMFASLP